jgi:phosphohistidine phosphatase
MISTTKRSVTLIRHAKSSWNNPGLIDFERPLNKRGRKDAPRVGQYLANAGINFDRVLCSEAVRARETLRGLRTMIKLDDDAIEYHEDLYLSSPATIRMIIAEHAADKRDIAVIAHNPGLEDLARQLSDYTVDRMPTCCVVRLSFAADDTSWEQVLRGTGEIELYLLPRELD